MSAPVELRNPWILPLLHLIMKLVHVKCRVHYPLFLRLWFYRSVVSLCLLWLIQSNPKSYESTCVFLVWGSLKGRIMSSLPKCSSVSFQGHQLEDSCFVLASDWSCVWIRGIIFCWVCSTSESLSRLIASIDGACLPVDLFWCIRWFLIFWKLIWCCILLVLDLHQGIILENTAFQSLPRDVYCT